jgi:predicted SnoaL-like aldol condensation-catalyzing enzyme
MFRAGAGLALAATATPLLAPVSAQAQSNLSAKEKEEVIRDIFKSFETKNQDVLKYVNSETFIQHNLNIEDGIQGLRTFYAKLPKDIKIKIIRIFVDGDYVVAQREISFPGKERVSIDVFRFEEGQVVEHWENLEDKCPPNFSGRTQIDGPTAVTDTDKTVANKKVFQNYMDIIIFGGQKDRVGEFRSLDNYHQHNCQAEDNKSGFQLTRGIFSKPGAVFKVERSHLEREISLYR